MGEVRKYAAWHLTDDTGRLRVPHCLETTDLVVSVSSRLGDEVLFSMAPEDENTVIIHPMLHHSYSVQYKVVIVG